MGDDGLDALSGEVGCFVHEFGVHFLIFLLYLEQAHFFILDLVGGFLSFVFDFGFFGFVTEGVEDFFGAEDGVHFPLKVHKLITSNGFVVLHALGVELEGFHNHLLGQYLV